MTTAARSKRSTKTRASAHVRQKLAGRPVVLVGLMGAGKTTAGRRLAQKLELPFTDADAEIENAANKTVAEIFEEHGESAFRAGEQKVIARLLRGEQCVLATGGGAYMDARTRRLIRERAVSIWLRADLTVLMSRVRRRGGRPLLAARDPEAVMRALIDERSPVYAQADIVVDSRNVAHGVTVTATMKALKAFLDDECEDN